MDGQAERFGVILGMALVTALPRVLPLLVVSRLSLPNWLARWLSLVPPAVLAALTVREVTMVNDRVHLVPLPPALVAAVPTVIVAVWRRSLLATVMTGVVAMALLRWATRMG